MLLSGIEPMRVHFTQAAFLEDNPHVRHLFALCRDVMTEAFSTPADEGQDPGIDL